MTNVLLISYHFAPNNSIGAVRPTKIAKYLTRLGADVTVICAEPDNIVDEKFNRDTRTILKLIRVRHTSYYNLYLKLFNKLVMKAQSEKYLKENVEQTTQKRKSKLITHLKSKVRKVLDDTRAILRDYNFKRNTIKSLKDNDINLSSVNVVISTYNIFGNHMVANQIKKKYPHITWITDYRDPVFIPYKDKSIKELYYKYMNNKYLEACDHIVAVSKGYLEMITNGRYYSKSHVIYNGYDPEEKVNKSNNKIYSKKLKLVYTGGLYLGKRDLSPLFHTIKNLIKMGKINKNNVEFIYAGKEKKYFDSLAKRYGLSEIIRSYNFVTRSKALELQNESDILVVATWNFQKYWGVLPGKFFEYMHSEKNIIALVEGDKENSEIKQIINNCNNGICYEKANAGNDSLILSKFLEDSYNEKLAEGKVSMQICSDEINKYNYKNLSAKIYSLMNKN